jgi:hypothetical protein
MSAAEDLRANQHEIHCEGKPGTGSERGQRICHVSGPMFTRIIKECLPLFHPCHVHYSVSTSTSLPLCFHGKIDFYCLYTVCAVPCTRRGFCQHVSTRCVASASLPAATPPRSESTSVCNLRQLAYVFQGSSARNQERFVRRLRSQTCRATYALLSELFRWCQTPWQGINSSYSSHRSSKA